MTCDTEKTRMVWLPDGEIFFEGTFIWRLHAIAWQKAHLGLPIGRQ